MSDEELKNKPWNFTTVKQDDLPAIKVFALKRGAVEHVQINGDELIEEIKNICLNIGEPERTEAIKAFIEKVKSL